MSKFIVIHQALQNLHLKNSGLVAELKGLEILFSTQTRLVLMWSSKIGDSSPFSASAPLHAR